MLVSSQKCIKKQIGLKEERMLTIIKYSKTFLKETIDIIATS